MIVSSPGRSDYKILRSSKASAGPGRRETRGPDGRAARMTRARLVRTTGSSLRPEYLGAVYLPVAVEVETVEHYGKISAVFAVAGQHLVSHVGEAYYGGLGGRSR